MGVEEGWKGGVTFDRAVEGAENVVFVAVRGHGVAECVGARRTFCLITRAAVWGRAWSGGDFLLHVWRDAGG